MPPQSLGGRSCMCPITSLYVAFGIRLELAVCWDVKHISEQSVSVLLGCVSSVILRLLHGCTCREQLHQSKPSLCFVSLSLFEFLYILDRFLQRKKMDREPCLCTKQEQSHDLFITLVGHRTTYLQFILCCNTSVGGLERLFEDFIFIFFWYAHSHLCAFRFVEELKASKFLPMFLTPSSNEMKYSTYGEELSRCLSGGLWNAFGIMFMMPKTRAGFSLAELPIASVTAALVFWVNHQTYPYLYPSNISDCLRHSCVHSGEHA